LPEKCKTCDYLRDCRGSCWLHRLTGDYCYLPVAEKVAQEYGIS
jgi:radical SAM protein with 4Fe4S-binding SPASM domain